MSLGAFEGTMLPSMNDAELQQIADGNLLQPASLEVEVDEVKFEGEARDYTNHGVSVGVDEHYHAQIVFQVTGNNSEQAGRKYTEHLRFFNYGNPETMGKITEGLKTMHDMAFSKLYAIITASGVNYDDDAGGKNLTLPLINGGLKGTLLRVAVGKKARKDGNGNENTFAYRPA